MQNSKWLQRVIYPALCAFALLLGASALQLRSQVSALNETGCNVISCASDSDCEVGHPLCAACQSYGTINHMECSTVF